jgi:hypothetical protein
MIVCPPSLSLPQKMMDKIEKKIVMKNLSEKVMVKQCLMEGLHGFYMQIFSASWSG